jgi:hypothetical protein
MSYPKFTEYELEAFKEHEKELLDEEDSITQAIKDLKLDVMSRDALQRKAARWKLELDALEHPAEELLNKNIKNLKESLSFWFSGTFTNEDGKPNKLGKVIKKYLSRINSKNAKSDRPRLKLKAIKPTKNELEESSVKAIKPTKDELEEFRVKFQDKRERDGLTGDYGWIKAAVNHYGYSRRRISAFFNKK